jgi:hypothetical protein
VAKEAKDVMTDKAKLEERPAAEGKTTGVDHPPHRSNPGLHPTTPERGGKRTRDYVPL